MVEHYHGDIKVNWTNDEWERLQKIKRGEDVPYVGALSGKRQIYSYISDELYDKAKVYAQNNGKTLSQVIKETLYILAY